MSAEPQIVIDPFFSAQMDLNAALSAVHYLQEQNQLADRRVAILRADAIRLTNMVDSLLAQRANLEEQLRQANAIIVRERELRRVAEANEAELDGQLFALRFTTHTPIVEPTP